MTLPIEVKLTLERKALELGVTIVGVHSVCLIDDTTVNAIFDIEPDVNGGNGLHFNFALPQLVAKDDLNLFAWWLVAPDHATIH
jgi:hypothetical protein